MSTFVTVKEKTLARCRKMGSTIMVDLFFLLKLISVDIVFVVILE